MQANQLNHSIKQEKMAPTNSVNSNTNKMDNMQQQQQQQMHICRLCDKLLSSSSSLDRHMLTHSGERPFVCKRCHMTFTTNGNMHRHMRTHLHKDSLARQQQEQMQLKHSLLGVAAAAAAAAAAAQSTATTATTTGEQITSSTSSTSGGQQQSSNNTHLVNTTCAPAALVPQLLMSSSSSGSVGANSMQPAQNPGDPFLPAVLGPLLMNQQLMAALRQQQQQQQQHVSGGKPNISNQEHLKQNSSISGPIGASLAGLDCASGQSLESVRAVMLAAAAAAAAATGSAAHQSDQLEMNAREGGKRRKQVRPRSHKQRASSASSSSSPTRSNMMSRPDSDADADDELERMPPLPTRAARNQREQKSTREELGQDVNNNQNEEDRITATTSVNEAPRLKPNEVATNEDEQCATDRIPAESEQRAFDDEQNSADDDEERANSLHMNSSNYERTSRLDTVTASGPALDCTEDEDEHRAYSSSSAMGLIDYSQDELSMNQDDDIKRQADDDEENDDDDGDDDDDEGGQDLRGFSRTNSNQTIGSNNNNNSNNNDNNNLPITTINGEVIEDISQSYVKTANPNAAKKGGKRNRHCYKCKLCTYSSVDRCTLVRHLRIHSGERPYICGICRYAFTTKANCERHVRKRHKKQYNSLGGSGGVKGSNGGGRSLIITDHSNHQTIPVKVNPVAAQTISQTLQRIQEKEMLEQQHSMVLDSHQQRHLDDQMLGRTSIDSNNNNSNNNAVSEQNGNNSIYLDKRASPSTGSSASAFKRKQRLLLDQDNHNQQEPAYQRRRLTGKQSPLAGLFTSPQTINNLNLPGNSLLAHKHGQPQVPLFPFSSTAAPGSGSIDVVGPERTAQLNAATSELLANFVAQLQANNLSGGGNNNGLMHHPPNNPFFSPFNPLDLAAQALDLSCVTPDERHIDDIR